MAQFGSGVEYAIHCLLHVARAPEGVRLSTREIAQFQGVSPAYVAKLFTSLQRGGLVRVAEGSHGGFWLARPAHEITVLDIVEAVDGRKPLFVCREVRRRCVLHEGVAPTWASADACAVSAVMRDAEGAMRARLAQTTLESLAAAVSAKAPASFVTASDEWFAARHQERTDKSAAPRSDLLGR